MRSTACRSSSQPVVVESSATPVILSIRAANLLVDGKFAKPLVSVFTSRYAGLIAIAITTKGKDNGNH